MPRNGFFFLFMMAVAARRDRNGTGAEPGEAAGKCGRESGGGGGGSCGGSRRNWPRGQSGTSGPGGEQRAPWRSGGAEAE